MIKNSTAAKVAENTIYQFLGKFSTMTITIIATLLITRAYGREAYGQFSLMQNWPAIFFIIVDFGFNAIATKELSLDGSKANKFLGNLLILRFIFSAIFIFFLWAVLPLFPYSESLVIGIRLSLFLVLTQSLFTTCNIIFQTKLKYDYSTISLLSGYGLILALVLLVSYFRLSIIWVSFSYVLGGLVSFLVALKFIRKLGVWPDFTIDLDLWRNLFIQSLPLGIMFIFSQINFKEDEILLSFLPLPKSFGLSNVESAGVYSLPYKIFDVLLVVPTFFMNATYPIMIRHMAEGPHKLKETFSKALGVLSVAGIGFGILGVLLSGVGIQVLGGVQFTRSVPVLQILSAGIILFYLTQPISWLIVTLGKQKYLPFIYAVTAVLNLVLNVHFIPKYSFYAAAVVTHASEFVILLLLVYAARKAWKAYYA